MEEFQLIAKTFQGLEEVLAKELTELGANNIEIGRRMVSFTGNKELMYRANFSLRTALRILKPIKHFKAVTPDEVYDAVKSIDWKDYLDLKTTFAVDSVVYSDVFRHSKFVAYKVKDAIVDYFRETTGERPSISVANPNIKLNIHIAEDDCTLSLDSSGQSLHLRGYRAATVDAPINEVLAAGMVLLSGWNGECDLIDPMCGSGTILIEAALIARNIAPGLFRKEYAFENWKDFDKDLFDHIYNDDSQERTFEHHIYGYDNNPAAINSATANVKSASLTDVITLETKAFIQFTQPEEKAMIIMNPPYGERIGAPDMIGLYRTIGERFKHQFIGNEAWIIAFKEELIDQIGLKPSQKIPLTNGSLECQFLKYQIFDGKLKAFRSNDGVLKTDADRHQMENKGRFRSSGPRNFKSKSDDTNEDGIPAYMLKKHRDFVESQEKLHRSRRKDDHDDKPKPFAKGGGGRKFGDHKPSGGGDREKRFGGDREKRFGGDKEKRFGGDREKRFGGDRDRRPSNGPRREPRSFGRDGRPSKQSFNFNDDDE